MNSLSPRTVPYTGANAAHDGSLAQTVNFPAIALTGSRLSMGFSWTGTPTGSLKLQHSFDGASWFDTPGASTEFTAQPAGAPGSLATNWANVPGTLARIAYTRTSGTGTLSSWLCRGPA